MKTTIIKIATTEFTHISHLRVKHIYNKTVDNIILKAEDFREAFGAPLGDHFDIHFLDINRL